MSKSHSTLKANIIFIIALITAAAVFITSAVMLIMKLLPENYDYDRFKNHALADDGSSDVVIELSEKGENPINFDELLAYNPDVCGWIMVEGTSIDYPILRNTQKDFYLNHNLDKKKDVGGSIYIESLNYDDFSDPNTVIYGHNMLNGSKFATLKKFRDADFFNTNKYIYIYTPGHIYRYQIFSAFVYDDRHLLNSYNFYIRQGMQAFIDVCKKPPSLVKNVRDMSVTPDDKLITLSTCTSKKNERYLVVAKFIEDIETK